MSLKIFACVCFAILLHSALVNAQPERCYFCNSEVHGAACHEPINAGQIQIQRCSDSEIVTSESYASQVWDFFELHNVFAEKRNVSTRITYPDVCVQMTYQFDSRNVSVRGCEAARMRIISSGELDICRYYREMVIPARIYNFNCTACSDNLCNHDNYGSSAAAFSVSLKLMVVMILSKMIFV